MVDKKRILARLDELDGYIKELAEIMPVNFQDYMDDKEARRACERLLQISIECVIDISSILVKGLKSGLPSNEDDVFDSLKKKKIISAGRAGTLKSMKGFRNILVHRYAEVDDEQVFDFLKSNLKDFSVFKKEILKIIR